MKFTSPTRKSPTPTRSASPPTEFSARALSDKIFSQAMVSTLDTFDYASATSPAVSGSKAVNDDTFVGGLENPGALVLPQESLAVEAGDNKDINFSKTLDELLQDPSADEVVADLEFQPFGDHGLDAVFSAEKTIKSQNIEVVKNAVGLYASFNLENQAHSVDTDSVQQSGPDHEGVVVSSEIEKPENVAVVEESVASAPTFYHQTDEPSAPSSWAPDAPFVASSSSIEATGDKEGPNNAAAAVVEDTRSNYASLVPEPAKPNYDFNFDFFKAPTQAPFLAPIQAHAQAPIQAASQASFQAPAQTNMFEGAHANMFEAARANIFQAPQANIFQAPQANMYQAPQASMYQAPHTNIFQAPQANIYQAPQASMYQAPHTNIFQASQANMHQAPQASMYQAPQANMFQASVQAPVHIHPAGNDSGARKYTPFATPENIGSTIGKESPTQSPPTASTPTSDTGINVISGNVQVGATPVAESRSRSAVAENPSALVEPASGPSAEAIVEQESSSMPQPHLPKAPRVPANNSVCHATYNLEERKKLMEIYHDLSKKCPIRRRGYKMISWEKLVEEYNNFFPQRPRSKNGLKTHVKTYLEEDEKEKTRADAAKATALALNAAERSFKDGESSAATVATDTPVAAETDQVDLSEDAEAAAETPIRRSSSKSKISMKTQSLKLRKMARIKGKQKEGANPTDPPRAFEEPEEISEDEDSGLSAEKNIWDRLHLHEVPKNSLPFSFEDYGVFIGLMDSYMEAYSVPADHIDIKHLYKAFRHHRKTVAGVPGPERNNAELHQVFIHQVCKQYDEQFRELSKKEINRYEKSCKLGRGTIAGLAPPRLDHLEENRHDGIYFSILATDLLEEHDCLQELYQSGASPREVLLEGVKYFNTGTQPFTHPATYWRSVPADRARRKEIYPKRLRYSTKDAHIFLDPDSDDEADPEEIPKDHVFWEFMSSDGYILTGLYRAWLRHYPGQEFDWKIIQTCFNKTSSLPGNSGHWKTRMELRQEWKATYKMEAQMVKEGKIADLPPWIEVAKAREKRKWGRYDSDEDEDQEPRNASQDEDNSQHPRKSPKQSATDDATGSFRSPKSPKGKGAEKRADNEDADYDTDHEGDVMGDSD